MKLLVRIQNSLALGCLAMAVGSGLPNVASAQSLNDEALAQKSVAEPTTEDWDFTLGLDVAATPVYPGAKRYHAQPIPLPFVRYKDLVTLGPEGLSINAIDWHGFRAGPVLGIGQGRKSSDDDHLRNLSDIQTSLTGGAFAAYRFGPFEISGTARQSITQSSNGLLGVARFSYRQSIIPEVLDFSVGPHVEFADAQYNRTWFGVSAAESANSGLQTYTPGAGIKDAGLDATMAYHYSPHIILSAFGNASELTGDAANSPIVERKTQLTIGLGVAYHF